MRIVIKVRYKIGPNECGPDGFSDQEILDGLYIDENGELTPDVTEATWFESFSDAALHVEGIEALTDADPHGSLKISEIILENLD